MLPILLTFWPFLETALKKNKQYLDKCPVEEETNIQRNVLSAVNAIGTIILASLYLKTRNNMLLMATILYPIVFYIYDMYYIWFNKINTKYPYIVHHCAGVYYLQCVYLYDDYIKKAMLLGLIALELSNLPLYYVYNFLKTNTIKDEAYYTKLLSLKRIQLAIYGFLRIFVFGYIIKNYSNAGFHQPILITSIISLFCMGLFWFQHQVKGYFKTKKELNALKDNK